MAVKFIVETPDPHDWDLSAQVKRASESTVKQTALSFWGEIRRESPVDEGRLAGSWEIRQTGKMSWVVYTNVEYAASVALGSDPHAIVPRQRTMLRFVIGDRTIYARRVNHPGTPANLFWQRAMRTTESQIPIFAGVALAREGLG